jgi:hypothetical protein
MGGQPIGSRCAPDSEVDAAGSDGLEHAELFSHFERGVVRQHDPRTAHTNPPRRRGNCGDQNFGCRADNAGSVVMLRDPVALIAQCIALLRERDGFADRNILSVSRRGGRLIEY